MQYEYCQIDLFPYDYEYELAGFSQRHNSEDDFGLEEMKLKLLWLKADNANQIFISLDSLYFPTELSNIFYEYFARVHGVNNQSIIFNATHTHSSPNISLSIFGKVNEEYMQHISSLIKHKLENIGGNFNECELFVNEVNNIDTSLTIGRRNPVRSIKHFLLKKTIQMLPNENQFIDSNIRLLIIKDTKSQLLGLIYNFSCHPVFAKNNRISSDFPGLINAKFEEYNFIFSMFLQGFCGDVRPNITHKIRSLKDLKLNIKVLLFKRVFGTATSQDLEVFSDNYFQLMAKKLTCISNKVTKFKQRSFEFEFSSATDLVQKKALIKVVIMNHFIAVSIPAEVLSSYYELLESAFPDFSVLPLGYSEGMIGYLPASNEMDEGGYEVLSAPNYGWDAPLSSNSIKLFEKRLINEIEELVKG